MGCWPAYEGAAQLLHDVGRLRAGADMASAGGDGVWGGSPDGAAVTSATGSWGTSGTPIGFLASITVMVSYLDGRTDNQGGVFALIGGGAVDLAWRGSAQPSLVWEGSGPIQPNTLTCSGITRNAPHIYVAVITDSRQEVWVDGVLNASSSFGGHLYDYSPYNFLVLRDNAGYQDTNSTFYHAILWDRALSAAEIASATENPWQVCGSPRSYFLMKHATTAATLVRRTLYPRAGSRGVA